MKRALYVGAIGLAILELAITPMMDEPAVSVAFAVLFVAMAAWYWRRGTRPPLYVLAAMFVVELAFLPMYDRTDAADWFFQGATAVLGATGLVGAVGLAVRGRRPAVSAT